MLVEVDFAGGKSAAGLYVHKRLPEAMGRAVAGFARAVLEGGAQPGVWYPEEREALAVRSVFLWFLFALSCTIKHARTALRPLPLILLPPIQTLTQNLTHQNLKPKQDRRAYLDYAARGCARFELNKSAWELESPVKQIIGLVYW
jgi:hypothetical protein